MDNNISNNSQNPSNKKNNRNRYHKRRPPKKTNEGNRPSIEEKNQEKTSTSPQQTQSSPNPIKETSGKNSMPAGEHIDGKSHKKRHRPRHHKKTNEKADATVLEGKTATGNESSSQRHPSSENTSLKKPFHKKKKHSKSKNQEKPISSVPEEPSLQTNSVDSFPRTLDVSENSNHDEFLQEDISSIPQDILDSPPQKKINEPIEVVGVKFKQTGKTYYFSPQDFVISPDTPVIVETARGLEFGKTATSNKIVDVSETVAPLRKVERLATAEDIARHEENIEKERVAFELFNKKINEHKLEMKLVDVEYTFDNSKLLFYFSAEGRIDFRDLVKDLAAEFKTRIELRQIGIRDEAKMMGGLGICGRTLCCHSFLNDFVQVSIKMAKEQNLSLNSSKISGTCGRLMCCLRYEHETYEAEAKITPPVGSLVLSPDGEGVVIETSPLAGLVKVRLTQNPDQSPKMFKREDLTVKDKDKEKSEASVISQEPNLSE